MSRCVVGILAFGLLVQCGGGTPPATERESSGESLIGRWDVTVSQGEESYPLWFEVERSGPGFAGHFQPSGGHVQPMKSIVIDSGHLQFSCCGFELEGHAGDPGLEGTGQHEGKTFRWKAVEAPALPALEVSHWGDPIDLLAQGKEGWKAFGEDPDHWEYQEGVLLNTAAGANLVTTQQFKDFKLHIEVNCPTGSNSGIYLRGRYEVQVQDDFGKPPSNRGMGGIYGRIAPSTNAARPAGEWQEFDVTLTGRWVTVVLNGEKIIDQQEIPGLTGGALDANEAEPGPFYLQGDHGPVSYRNILVQPATD